MRNKKGQFIKGQHYSIKTEFKKGLKPWNNGLRGIHFSPNTEFKKGKLFTQQEKIEWSKRAKKLGIGNWMKGKIPAFILQGKHFAPKGNKHPNWRGGISKFNTQIRGSNEYKKWRRDIFIRDHFTCQKCKHRFINITAHHIKSFKDFKNLWFDRDNGITLCKNCHTELHKKRGGLLVGSLSLLGY